MSARHKCVLLEGILVSPPVDQSAWLPVTVSRRLLESANITEAEEELKTAMGNREKGLSISIPLGLLL